MSDALTPLRHVYGVEPFGAPLAPGDAGHAEQEALRQLCAALDAWPAPPPAPDAVAAVEARARVIAAAVGQTDAALARAFSDRPSLAPSATTLDAVLARAAAPVAEPLPAASPVEAAVLDQSLAALDRLPSARPDAAVLAAVAARAAQASAAEAAALDPMRAALGRAFAARPQPRPSADAVAAVLARAAEPAPDALPAASAVEAAVLDQSLQALDRLPRPRPTAATLDAVRVAAATATPVVAPAADRAAVLPFYQRTPVWGTAALVMAALVAVVILPFGGVTSDAPVAVATVAEAADAVPAPRAEAPTTADDDAPASLPPASGRSASVVGAIAASGFTPAVQRPPAGPTAKDVVKRSAAPPPAAARPAETPTWETSDDVRMLSLRLQELDGADALAWDEAPAEAFGSPSLSSAGAAPGIQAVRAGAPAVRAPARARLRSDSTSANR